MDTIYQVIVDASGVVLTEYHVLNITDSMYIVQEYTRKKHIPKNQVGVFYSLTSRALRTYCTKDMVHDMIALGTEQVLMKMHIELINLQKSIEMLGTNPRYDLYTIDLDGKDREIPFDGYFPKND